MSNRHRRRLVTAVLFIGLLVALTPGVVLGHAELDTASPADKSTVAAPPTEIVMTFTEPLDPKKSSLKLADAGGKIVGEGSTVDTGDAKTMRLTVAAQPAGIYTVRWTSASALDGDLDHGTTTFTIAAATPSPSVAPPSSQNPTAEPATPSSSAAAPSAAAPSPSPSGGGATPTAASDAVVPVIAALVVLAALGLWLLRGRSRRAG